MELIPEKYINPFTDFGFKKLFGTEVNKDLLIDFLNELIHEKGKITSVTYLNAEQLGRSAEDRKAVYDIYCESSTGEKFIVEMQKAKQDYFKDRSVFYSTFPIREQAIKGDWDYQLSSVYTIGVLNFVFNETKEDENYYHSEVKLMDTKKKTVFYDKLTFIYLEMPKFKKTVAELKTHFDKWMYILKNLPDLQELPPKLRKRIFMKVCKVAAIAKMNKEEIAEYERSLKDYRDWYSTFKTARNEGERNGMKKGLAKGLAKGEAERHQLKAELEAVQAEKDNAIAEKDNAIAEKDNAIAEKDNAIAEKDNAIAEKDNIIAQGKAEREQLQAEKEAQAHELAELRRLLSSNNK